MISALGTLAKRTVALVVLGVFVVIVPLGLLAGIAIPLSNAGVDLRPRRDMRTSEIGVVLAGVVWCVVWAQLLAAIVGDELARLGRRIPSQTVGNVATNLAAAACLI